MASLTIYKHSHST